MTRKTAASFKPSGERGTGLGKKISDSLSAQLLCGVLISILAAVLTFFAMLHLGNALLNSTVYGQPFEEKMASLQFDSLQEYVTEENITQDTIQQLNVWCHQGRRVYLTVYKDGAQLFASDVPSHAPVNSDGNRKDEDPDSEFALTLSDGTDVQAFLYYFASIRYHSVMVAVSYLSAFLAFSVCFIILVHRKLAYVKKMKSELDILAGGALEYPVTVRGNDELGQLAYGIDQMRQSILAHQRTEELTRSASSQLVTAMSHDLRTPLTSLLAYLELMDRGKYQNEEQLHQFIKKVWTRPCASRQWQTRCSNISWCIPPPASSRTWKRKMPTPCSISSGMSMPFPWKMTDLPWTWTFSRCRGMCRSTRTCSAGHLIISIPI